MKMRHFAWIGSSLSALVIGSAVQAQSTPPPAAADSEEIIVTAQRRSENVQKVPISISAFRAQTLIENRVQQPADLARLTPGLTVTSPLGGLNPIFSIRGVGLNDTFANNNPTVGVYIDEAVQPLTPLLSGQFYDLERVEVLKGPQGTLYGKNTTGGAINIITAKPTQKLSGYAQATYARFGRFEFEGGVGGGITSNLAIRLSGKTVQQSGGWQHNAFDGKTLGKVDNKAIRLQALWKPTDRLEILIKGELMKDDSDVLQPEHIGYYAGAFGAGGYCAAALAGKRDETSCVDFLGYSFPSKSRRTVDDSSVYGTRTHARSQALTARINYDLGGATLTSVTGYNHFKRVAGVDSDGAGLIELDSQFTDKIHSFTQELRLASNTPSSPLTYVAGLFYSYDKIDGDVLQALDEHIFLTRVDTHWIQRTKSYAAFGQLDYKFSDKLKLTGGLRYTSERKRYAYNGFDLDPFGTSVNLPTPVAGIKDHINQNDLSGKVSLQYTPNRDLMLYASFSKGFKSGGFKGAIAFDPNELTPFKGEKLYAYEAGFKSTLDGGRLTLNGAAYYYDYHGFQAMVTEIRGGLNVVTLSNAGNARVWGGELEANWRPSKALTLRGSMNYLNTKITKFNTVPGAGDNKGNRLANAPKFSFTGTARYELPIDLGNFGIYVLGDASYKSKVYYSLANRDPYSQKGYWLVNARVALHTLDNRWEVAVFGNNIFNKLYVSNAYDNFGGIFPSQDYIGDPATYGVSASFHF
jgi:iron complex outermembrane receptor protein